MTVQEVLFSLLGLLTAGAAALVVTTRNVVRAALWLVVALGGVAAEYLLLAAPFVAWVQVLVYIGAVVVLLLFAVMLTRAPTGIEADLDSANKPAAALVGVASAGSLVALLVSAFRGAYIDLHHSEKAGAYVTGNALFRSYVLPFEVVSVLLLAALVGAIVLSRPDVAADSPDTVAVGEG